MRISLKRIAQHKTFVPTIILILILIVISSLSDKKSTNDFEALTLEKQLEEMCNSIEGVKNAKVMITYENLQAVSIFENKNQTKILGIAIVCEGGENPVVKLKLYDMLKALFGISSTRITVSERNINP